MTHIEVEALWEQTERECLGLKDWAKRSHFAALVARAERYACLDVLQNKQAYGFRTLGQAIAEIQRRAK